MVVKLVTDSKTGKAPTASVSAEDFVAYGDVISTIDWIKENGLEGVALRPN